MRILCKEFGWCTNGEVLKAPAPGDRSVHYGAEQYSTVQYSTVQFQYSFSTVQYSSIIIQNGTVQYHAVQGSTVHYIYRATLFLLRCEEKLVTFSRHSNKMSNL
jgi:hypothetical protein